MKRLLIILFVFLLPASLFADEKVKEKKVAKYIMENIQKDYLDCYSFYKVAAESFKKAGKDQGIIKFELMKGDFRKFEGSWEIKNIRNSDKNSLIYDLTVKGCQWMPIGMIEKRLKRDLSENLIAVDKQARKFF